MNDFINYFQHEVMMPFLLQYNSMWHPTTIWLQMELGLNSHESGTPSIDWHVAMPTDGGQCRSSSSYIFHGWLQTSVLPINPSNKSLADSPGALNRHSAKSDWLTIWPTILLTLGIHQWFTIDACNWRIDVCQLHNAQRAKHVRTLTHTHIHYYKEKELNSPTIITSMYVFPLVLQEPFTFSPTQQQLNSRI